MNSRSIALGASVIVLALAGPGRAEAGTLGQLGTELPDTDVAVQVKANVKTNAKVPVELPSKGSLGGAHSSGETDTSVKAKGEAGTTGSEARVGIDGRADGGTGKLGVHGGLQQGARVKGVARENGVKGGLTATSRAGAKVDAGRRHGRVSAKAKGHAKHSIKTRSRVLTKPHWSDPAGGHTKDVVPLRGIGREVGNPIQLSLAGWLIALTGAGCFGASRFVRRLQRARW
jgi:hypothetical protein